MSCALPLFVLLFHLVYCPRADCVFVIVNFQVVGSGTYDWCSAVNVSVLIASGNNETEKVEQMHPCIS